jgi:hypothetical protein
MTCVVCWSTQLLPLEEREILSATSRGTAILAKRGEWT